MNPFEPTAPEELDEAQKEVEQLKATCERLLASVSGLVDALEVLVLEETADQLQPVQA